MLVCLLVAGVFVSPAVNAQTADPSTATITVSGVPDGTSSLAVELTIDTAVISLPSASTDASGALAVAGNNGIGIANLEGGSLPASFTITVNISGVADGTSALTVGNVVDKIGGTAIAGASAASDVTSVTVSTDGGSSSSTTSSSTSSSSSTGGVGGNLDNDTVTITITGDAVNTTSALNVTLAFGDTSIAGLDSAAPTFSANGATQLLTSADPATGVVSAVWNGNVSDGVVTLTAMLAPGANAGTTTIGVSKVEAAGGADITGNVVAQVNPSSVTNSATAAGDCGSFTLLAPDTVTRPGNTAVGFRIDNPGTNISGTVNGSELDVISVNGGAAIVSIPDSGDLTLNVDVTCTEGSSTFSLGPIPVTDGVAGARQPEIRGGNKSARVVNKANVSNLTIRARRRSFAKDATTVEIIPTDKNPNVVKAKRGRVMSKYDPAECIPDGSYANVVTDGGTDARKLRVRGMAGCANPLINP